MLKDAEPHDQLLILDLHLRHWISLSDRLAERLLPPGLGDTDRHFDDVPAFAVHDGVPARGGHGRGQVEPALMACS